MNILGRLNVLVSSCLTLGLLTSCGGSTSRGFGSSGTALTLDDVVNTPSTGFSILETATATEYYYGRIFIHAGAGDDYVGSIRVQILKDTDSTAHFSEFKILNLASVSNIGTSSAISACANTSLLNVTDYDATNNAFTVSDATNRFTKFAFQVPDISTCVAEVSAPVVITGGLMVSKDANIIVGGDNSSFMFMVEKASSLETLTSTSGDGTYDVIPFTVSSSGVITTDTAKTATVAFPAVTTSVTDEAYTLGFPDATSGAFAMHTGADAAETADVDGGYMVSNDHNYAIGVVDGVYFSAWKQ